MTNVQHVSMFKAANNKLGYMQCVIGPQFVEDFEKDGFVTSPDKIQKKAPKKAVVIDESNKG